MKLFRIFILLYMFIGFFLSCSKNRSIDNHPDNYSDVFSVINEDTKRYIFVDKDGQKIPFGMNVGEFLISKNEEYVVMQKNTMVIEVFRCSEFIKNQQNAESVTLKGNFYGGILPLYWENDKKLFFYSYLNERFCHGFHNFEENQTYHQKCCLRGEKKCGTQKYEDRKKYSKWLENHFSSIKKISGDYYYKESSPVN